MEIYVQVKSEAGYQWYDQRVMLAHRGKPDSEVGDNHMIALTDSLEVSRGHETK